MLSFLMSQWKMLLYKCISQYKMADIDQTFTPAREKANKQPFKGAARKKTKKA